MYRINETLVEDWKQAGNDITPWVTAPEDMNPFTREERELLEVYNQEIERYLGALIEEVYLDGAGTTSAGGYQLVRHYLARAQDLTPQEFRVLLVVRSYSWGENWCFQTLEKIAQEAGVSKSTARNCLQSLRKKKYLHFEPRNKENRHHANAYKPTSKVWGLNSVKHDDEFWREYGIEQLKEKKNAEEFKKTLELANKLGYANLEEFYKDAF